LIFCSSSCCRRWESQSRTADFPLSVVIYLESAANLGSRVDYAPDQAPDHQNQADGEDGPVERDVNEQDARTEADEVAHGFLEHVGIVFVKQAVNERAQAGQYKHVEYQTADGSHLIEQRRETLGKPEINLHGDVHGDELLSVFIFITCS